MKKPRRLYLGKDTLGAYGFGIRRSCWRPDYGFVDGALLMEFCVSAFEPITGIKLQPGEVRRVKRILIELED